MASSLECITSKIGPMMRLSQTSEETDDGKKGNMTAAPAAPAAIAANSEDSTVLSARQEKTAAQPESNGVHTPESSESHLLSSAGEAAAMDSLLRLRLEWEAADAAGVPFAPRLVLHESELECSLSMGALFDDQGLDEAALSDSPQSSGFFMERGAVPAENPRVNRKNGDLATTRESGDVSFEESLSKMYYEAEENNVPGGVVGLAERSDRDKGLQATSAQGLLGHDDELDWGSCLSATFNGVEASPRRENAVPVVVGGISVISAGAAVVPDAGAGSAGGSSADAPVFSPTPSAPATSWFGRIRSTIAQNPVVRFLVGFLRWATGSFTLSV